MKLGKFKTRYANHWSHKKRLFVSALVSAALAMPVGGFVFGFIHAPVSEYYNLLGRGFVGVEYAILTPLSLGFPPRALEDHAQSCDVWPYITICGFIIFSIYIAFACYTNGKTRS
jgi:hypothetical protein